MPSIDRPLPSLVAGPALTQTSDMASRVRDRGGGFLDRVSKWGIVGVAKAFVVPALIAAQLVGCSPAPTPPRPAPPRAVVVVDSFTPAPAAPIAPVRDAPAAPRAETPDPPQATSPGPTPSTQTPSVPAPPAPAQGGTDTVVVGAMSVPEAARAALSDGLVTADEAKAIVLGAPASIADHRALAELYQHARTSDDARDVLDVYFVRSGVPVGAGAEHVQATFERLARQDALGAPLRGRLNTAHLMKLELAPSAAFRDGATIWTAPGERATTFIEIPSKGTFGPVSLAGRVSG